MINALDLIILDLPQHFYLGVIGMAGDVSIIHKIRFLLWLQKSVV